MWRPGRRGKCPRTFAFDVVATALPHSGTASDHAGPLTPLCWLAAAPSRAFCRLWTSHHPFLPSDAHAAWRLAYSLSNHSGHWAGTVIPWLLPHATNFIPM